jgi:hypothetical protein
VLGAWVSGDLTGWKAGEWCTLPDDLLRLGTVVLGLPGAGKTETLLRLAELGLAGGYDVHIIDAKGDAATQHRFAAIAAAAGHDPKLFPDEAYDGWRGDATAQRNRFCRVVDYRSPTTRTAPGSSSTPPPDNSRPPSTRFLTPSPPPTSTSTTPSAKER